LTVAWSTEWENMADLPVPPSPSMINRGGVLFVVKNSLRTSTMVFISASRPINMLLLVEPTPEPLKIAA